MQFKSGGTYHYFGVPQHLADQMAKVESIGKFVGQELRGKFAYERQPDVPGGIVFGLGQAQEPKYTTTQHGRLVNRSTGKAIPDDEPVFILRAQDRKACEALAAYALVVDNPDHAAVVDQRITDFRAFAARHADRMKEPDSPALLTAARPVAEAA